MVRHGIGRLPVVDRNNEARLVGIITKGDVVKAYEIAARRLEEEA
ncbi:MAG: CBS domain-containing protein [Desulfurococcales archaeon]|nr:CBS domain-containing protein [Desulfurococcales archaeon]